MKNKSILFLFFLFFIANSLLGQNNIGKVKLKISPPIGISSLRIDDLHVIESCKDGIIRLEEGKHRIEFWAEAFFYKDTLIQVIPDSTILLKVNLKRDIVKRRADREKWNDTRSRSKIGQLNLNLSPPIGQSNIRIDSLFVIENSVDNSIELREGKHRIEIWASKHNIKDTVINVIAKSVMDLNITLKKDASYDSFLEYQTAYKRKQYSYKVPNIASVVFLLAGSASYFTTRDFKKEIDKRRGEYIMLGPDEKGFEEFHSELDAYKSQTKRRRTIAYGCLVTAAALKILGSINRKKFKQLNEDEYYFDASSPFKIGFSSDGNYNDITLTMKF